MKYLLLSVFLTHGGQPDMKDGVLLTVDRISPEYYTSPDHRTCPVIDNSLGKEGCWMDNPDILLCHGAPVNEHRVKNAMRYWESLGYGFGTVTQASKDNMSCAMGTVPYGTIMIDIPSQTFQFGKHLGSTRTWRNHDPIPSGIQSTCTGLPVIFKSKIEIIPAWGNTSRILEHEIGHSLGWNDITETGHIMNGVWSNGGYSSRGIRNAN